MSDLEGDDAFDRVLDRLVETTAKLNRDEGALVEARTAATSARAAQTILEKQVAELKRSNEVALPYLSELHAAAQEALGFIAPEDGTEKVRDRLRSALAGAGRYCDEIPF